MSSFLFIPTAGGRIGTRRVDFGNIATLFAELEEPVRRGGARREILRVAAALVLALLAIGDTFMLTHSAAFGGVPVPPAASQRTTS